MIKYFQTKTSLICDLSNSNLTELFSDWRSNDFLIKKAIDMDKLSIERKNIGGSEGNVVIDIEYKSNQEIIMITGKPFYAAYIFLVFVPMFYVVLLWTGKNFYFLYWVLPIFFSLMYLYFVKYGVTETTRMFMVELQLLLKKNGITYNLK